MTREDAILHMILRREELKSSVSDLDEDIKAFDMAIEALEQQKVGRWNSYRNEKGDWINECSVCEQDSGVLYPYNFCPNCGAKMEDKE